MSDPFPLHLVEVLGDLDPSDADVLPHFRALASESGELGLLVFLSWGRLGDIAGCFQVFACKCFESHREYRPRDMATKLFLAIFMMSGCVQICFPCSENSISFT